MDDIFCYYLGKAKLKFEMRSYQEKVVNDLRQMSEDNQQLIWLKNRVVKEQRHAKALEESLGIVSEKLRKTTEENRIVRHRTKTQHEETKEEVMLYMVTFDYTPRIGFKLVMWFELQLTKDYLGCL